MGRVLVTGGAGYIGCVLTEMLLEAGYEVRVLDRLFFGNTLEHVQDRPGLEIVQGDTRTVEPTILEGVDAVVDLAALSNDPAGELDPEITLAINFRARARMARMAKERGVGRYVVSSSCSVYGFQEGILNELSQPNPLTTYARANVEVEKANIPLADDCFTVTALRFATAYGLSPRMRFDLVINGMSLGIYEKGSIPVLRDGTQWRPMVHVHDIARSVLMTLRAEPARVNGQIIGVGSDEQNVQILPLAERLAQAVEKPFAFEWYGSPDNRSYRVNFTKVRELLEFAPERTPEGAAREIAQALATGRAVADMRTRTVEWYKSLIHWHQILRSVVLNDAVL